MRHRHSGPYLAQKISVEDISKRYNINIEDIVNEDVLNEMTHNGSINKSPVKFSKVDSCKSFYLISLIIAP
jgi:hypothetical protein